MTPSSSPSRPTYRLSRLGVLRGRYLFRPHRVRYSRLEIVLVAMAEAVDLTSVPALRTDPSRHPVEDDGSA